MRYFPRLVDKCLILRHDSLRSLTLRTRKTLYNRLTNRYQLVVRNDENFAQKAAVSFTYAKLIVLLVAAFLVILTIALFLSKGLLAFLFDPRYEQQKTQEELIALHYQIDSLAIALDQKERFVQKFKAIVEGDDALLMQADPQSEEEMLSPDEQLELSTLNQEIDRSFLSRDSAFRRSIEEEDPFALTSFFDASDSELSGVYFLSPLVGVVSSPYNPSIGHFGVDVVTKPNEPVLCVADGTVIFADWTQNDGYIIAVQHRENVISIYKHNNELLKKVGNFVAAGDVISIVGNTGEMSDGPHLHFEVWYNGNPVDPQEFVTF